jgi:hypothetical protein
VQIGVMHYNTKSPASETAKTSGTNVTLHATMMNNAGECRRLELDGGGQ